MENNKLSDICNHWDLRNTSLKWSDEFELNTINNLVTPGDEGRIEEITYKIKPLFQINEFQDAAEIFEDLKI